VIAERVHNAVLTLKNQRTKKKLILLAGSLMAIAAVATTVVAINSNDEASLLVRNVEVLGWVTRIVFHKIKMG
jgi:hypothetical protein